MVEELVDYYIKSRGHDFDGFVKALEKAGEVCGESIEGLFEAFKEVLDGKF